MKAKWVFTIIQALAARREYLADQPALSYDMHEEQRCCDEALAYFNHLSINVADPEEDAP